MKGEISELPCLSNFIEQKLTVVQLVKKVSTFYETQQFIIRFTNTSHNLMFF